MFQAVGNYCFPLLTVNQGSKFILDISGYAWSFLLLFSFRVQFWARESPYCFPPPPRTERWRKSQHPSSHPFQNTCFPSFYHFLWLSASRGELYVLLPLTFAPPKFSIMVTWEIVLVSDKDSVTFTPRSHNKWTHTRQTLAHLAPSFLDCQTDYCSINGGETKL